MYWLRMMTEQQTVEVSEILLAIPSGFLGQFAHPTTKTQVYRLITGYQCERVDKRKLFDQVSLHDLNSRIFSLRLLMW